MPDSPGALTPVSIEDGALLARWLDTDAEGPTQLAFYRDVRAWLRLVSDDRHGWIAHADGHPVGFLDLETSGRTGFFSYFVASAVRRRGHGRNLLSALVPVCHGLGIDRLVGFVEPENTASLATLRAAGFTVNECPDDDGMLTATRTLTGD